MSNEIYPVTFSEYVGQSDSVKLLRAATESAGIRKEPLGHILISSPEAGIGKTALAHLVAKTLGTRMESAMGPLDVAKARKIIHAMREGQVLFIDEFHLMKKASDWLLLYMQDGMLTARDGRLERAPRVTIVGATTNPEALDPTIVTRFQMHLKLKPYGYDEAIQIAEKMAARIFTGMKPWRYELVHVVNAANCNPRVIKQLLCTVRDLAITGNLAWNEDQGWDAREAMRLLGVYDDGLTNLHLQYLDTLVNMGGTAGLDTIVSIIQQKQAMPSVEKLLLEREYIRRESSGRAITIDGRDRIDLIDRPAPWEPDRPKVLAS